MVIYFIFFISVIWSNSAIASQEFFPCSAGIKHVDRQTEIKSGLDVLSITSEGVEANFRARIGTSQFVSASQHWSQVIDYLSFNLSTEVYGSEYFIEFCYKGPLEQVAMINGVKSEDMSEGIYRLALDLNTSHIPGVPLYRESAQLYYRYELICDLRKRGQYRAARLNSEMSAEYIEPDLIETTDYMPMDQDNIFFESLLNEYIAQVPRFCSFKIFFNEGSTEKRKYKLSVKDIQVGNSVVKE